MYLHAVAQERLPEQRRRFMDQLVDPRSSHLNIKQWRAEAVCAAARVQMELARDEKKSSWQDRQPRARLLHKAGAAAGNGAFWPLQHELAQDHLRQSQNWQDQPGGSATACSDWAPASSLTPDRWILVFYGKAASVLCAALHTDLRPPVCACPSQNAMSRFSNPLVALHIQQICRGQFSLTGLG